MKMEPSRSPADDFRLPGAHLTSDIAVRGLNASPGGDDSGWASAPGAVALSASPLLASSDNDARLLAAFSGALGIDSATVTEDMAYNSIPEWDSVAHMTFVTEVETMFDIMLDTNDIIDMNTFGNVRNIVRKYGVQLGA